MQCKGKFKFKELVKREGGSFTNQKGDVINYKDTYNLKVDEVTENGIYERIFKIPTESELVEPLLITKPYTDITLEFDVIFYGNSIRLTPISIVK